MFLKNSLNDDLENSEIQNIEGQAGEGEDMLEDQISQNQTLQSDRRNLKGQNGASLELTRKEMGKGKKLFLFIESSQNYFIFCHQ